MNKKISIIVPHFNSVDMVQKLMDSIPVDKRIQTIIVDDNSTEDITELRKYIDNAPANKQIELYTNDTGVKGAGSARNVGLDHAEGEWLLFADSDDYFTEGWLDRVSIYPNSQYDMVYFVPTSIDLTTGQVSSRHRMYAELVTKYYKKPSDKSLAELKYCFCTPWSKLIRKSIVDENNIRFDQVMASNDIMAITKCAFNSKKVAADLGVIYCVTRGGASLTSKKNKDNFWARIDVFIRRYCYVRENETKKMFKYAHLDRYALGKLVDVVLEGWGLKTFLEIVGMYRREHIKIWDVGLFNPFVLGHKAMIELSWWWDIKKRRKNK